MCPSWIGLFNAAVHHMLIAASGGSAVGERPDEFVFAERVQDGNVGRPVVWLDAEQSPAPIEPGFFATRLQKGEHANRSQHALTEHDGANVWRRVGATVP